MTLDPIYLQGVLLLLAILSCVAMVYVIIILVRIDQLTRKVENVVGYMVRAQAALMAWESVPLLILNTVKDFLFSFIGAKSDDDGTKKKRK